MMMSHETARSQMLYIHVTNGHTPHLVAYTVPAVEGDPLDEFLNTSSPASLIHARFCLSKPAWQGVEHGG